MQNREMGAATEYRGGDTKVVAEFLTALLYLIQNLCNLVSMRILSIETSCDPLAGASMHMLPLVPYSFSV
jgi:hypothetical protein